MNIYENVMELCTKHRITKTALEEACDFSQNSINKWQKSSPSIKNLIKVADYFDISVDYLLGREIPTTKKAVPVKRPENDAALLSNEDLKALLENNEGVDFIEKLYKELKSKEQRLFVLTWLIAYMASEGLPVKQILGK